jgi:hypothetical protein
MNYAVQFRAIMKKKSTGLNEKSLQTLILQALTAFEAFSAESGGFEPADAVTHQQFSRLPQSTTLPTLRDKSTNNLRFHNIGPQLFV